MPSCANAQMKVKMKSRLLVLFLCVPLLAASPAKSGMTPETRAALAHITAANLRGDLSFLASDEMQGRNTPSHELDIAAEFIASQFRRAGLQPAGDDGFFQSAKWVLADYPTSGIEMSFQDGERAIPIDAAKIAVQPISKLDLARIPTWKVDLDHLDQLTLEQTQGKALIVIVPPNPSKAAPVQMLQLQHALGRFHVAAPSLKPALVVTFMSGRAGGMRRPRRLVDPLAPAGPPAVSVYGDPAVLATFTAMKSGPSSLTVSLRAPAQTTTPVTLRNVIAMLPGSDPVLKDSYVLVTAHYDHLGVKPAGDGDRIFNGANDDGSGTVSVIAIGQALATLPRHPKRTIVFLTFFGEEKGEIGSQFYTRNPVFPIEKTVADVNLEQVGRTDSSEGPQIANLTFSGFDYSTLVPFFVAAGRETGVTVYKHEINSDTFFSRSDNQPLADVGIPAHTVCVAYKYPDYHSVGDEWQKIDYDNMAKVDRALALGLIRVADSPTPPTWVESNPKAADYVKAWKARRAK
jgi:hypothetical protein